MQSAQNVFEVFDKKECLRRHGFRQRPSGRALRSKLQCDAVNMYR